MKYSISENRLNEVIIDYINSMFPMNEINWTHPMEYDDFDEWEDESRVLFYLGDYDSDEVFGNEAIFRWYSCDYFDNPNTLSCPQIQIGYQYEKTLNSYFGDKWKEPFLHWFNTYFPRRKSNFVG